MIHDHRLSARAAYSGGDARLLQQFLPLVKKLAWHLAPSAGPAMDVDDLMQVGLIALTECARRHDRPTDDGLAAYAKLRVRGAMIDAIRKLQSDSRGARHERREIEAARSALAGQMGREPSEAELAARLGITPAEMAERQRRAIQVRHVEMTDAYDDRQSAFASDDFTGEDLLLEAESRAALVAALGDLPERHGLVIQLYFLEELNLAEIAAVLNVSAPRVHQLKAAALKSLKIALDESR
jgi:RNA polymerase sigma factor for flagellar operon FliA